jgi:hypothetical protein
MRRALAQLTREARGHERAVAAWEAVRQTLPESIDRSAGGLTICSVAYRAKSCLDLNHRLMRRLNPRTEIPDWLLFDNNTEPREMMDADKPGFTVVRPARRELEMGYEHALGISALLARVKTRFLLIQDPDCFVVMPDWIAAVPRHMEENQLGFFGVPINPRRHNSYRYFPYMVCMFVDLARVSPRDLCFVPDVWQLRTNVTYSLRRTLTRIPKIGYAFRFLLTEQYKTNGWRIKEKFGRGERVAFECAQPVWDLHAAVPSGTAKALLHNLTPARISPVPKQPGYCSAAGFKVMGAPDIAGLGWEEFVWRGRPFAFHVGSVHNKPGAYEATLERVVEQFG